jgi:hypothetical protein
MADTSSQSWLVALAPPRVDPTLQVPAGAWLRYLHLTWDEAARATRVEARKVWQRATDGRSQLLLASEAFGDDGLAIARVEVAFEVEGALARLGTGMLPRVPRVRHDTVRGSSVIIRPEEANDTLRAIGYGGGDFSSALWPGAMAVPMAPGALILTRVLGTELEEPAGDIEAWFHTPVPVGAVLHVHELDGHPVELWLPGRESPAITLRR